MKRAMGAMALLAAAACGGTAEPVAVDEHATYPVAAGDTVVLRRGDSVVVDGTVRVSFRTVEADSRCPVNVQCVWAGDAEIRLDVVVPDSAVRAVALHTNLEPRTATVGGYRIDLVAVMPVPAEPDTIQPHHYSVRLAISRG